MKSIFFGLFLSSSCLISYAQYETIFHPSSFKKFSGLMHSNAYKPDKDEKTLLDASAKTLFPSDIKKNPAGYTDTLIHWIGIVKDVSIKDSSNISSIVFTLEQKYWDYTEDYSVQDEVMFVSPFGEGDFHLLMQLELTEEQKEMIKKMPAEQTLFFCYGKIIADADLPALQASYIKTVDYKYYSTKIFSYKIKRDKEGHVVLNKKGRVEMDDFNMLKIAGKGQNKN